MYKLIQIVSFAHLSYVYLRSIILMNYYLFTFVQTQNTNEYFDFTELFQFKSIKNVLRFKLLKGLSFFKLHAWNPSNCLAIDCIFKIQIIGIT